MEVSYVHVGTTNKWLFIVETFIAMFNSEWLCW